MILQQEEQIWCWDNGARCPGLICGALASPIRYPGFVIGAELMAIKSDIDVCLPCGLINVCIFSDSLDRAC